MSSPVREPDDNEPLKDGSLKDASLKDASLKDASLKDASLKDASLKDASLKDASLKAASLKDASLKDASLKDASLKDASLKDASLKDASLKDASLKDASLKDGPKRARRSEQNSNLNAAPKRGDAVPSPTMPEPPEPPWKRETQQGVFAGDVAAVELRSLLALVPDRIPEPPPASAVRVFVAVGQLIGVILVAAAVASVVG